LAGSRLALHHLELNLTSENAPIYHPQRWHEAKSVLGHLFACPSKKMNFLSNTKKANLLSLSAPNLFWADLSHSLKNRG
jgi:hypothetical protein